MGGCVSKTSCNRDKASSPCLIAGFLPWRKPELFSDNGAALQDLYSIPNRIFTNGRSSTACLFTQQGRKGINQDAMIVWEKFMDEHEDITFCGIFDGHGPHGHLVARRVRDALPLNLSSILKASKSKKNGAAEEELRSMYKEAFLKSSKVMDKELRCNPNLDSFCSGSTAVTVLKKGSNLFMGNIGDSRAIMGSRDSNGSMVATQLTVDLKPDLPKEAERIKRCKGRLFALEDEPDVQRVWLPFDDAPGLAMARAFGDFCLKGYGVISVPEFSHRILTDRDCFIILASDGVWDVLENQEVVEIVSSAPARSSAARLVVEGAAREWRVKYPTTKMDDCAVVCLFLDSKITDSEAEHEDHQTSQSHNDDDNSSETYLRRNYTVRSSEDGDLQTVDANAKCEDDTWSGLEGLTRVNSLVRLLKVSRDRPQA